MVRSRIGGYHIPYGALESNLNVVPLQGEKFFDNALAEVCEEGPNFLLSLNNKMSSEGKSLHSLN